MTSVSQEREALKRQVRSHLGAFVILLVVIAVNVAMTYTPLDRPVRTTIQVLLSVIGAGLVLVQFMHLPQESRSTLLILACTGVLFLALMALTLVARFSRPALSDPDTSPPPAVGGGGHVS